MRSIPRQNRKRGQAFIASLLACLVLLLDGLAISPHTHECLHHDAKSRHHQCAISAFEQGLLEAGGFDADVPQPASIPDFIHATVLSLLATGIENLPAGRAPPMAFSNS